MVFFWTSAVRKGSVFILGFGLRLRLKVGTVYEAIGGQKPYPQKPYLYKNFDRFTGPKVKLRLTNEWH